jgi:lipid-binding SYLF domain-containing protein
MRTRFSIAPALLLSGLLALPAAVPTRADDKALIDANTERALAWLRASGNGTAQLLEQAAGVLVFPDLVKMGFGVGGEFGEGTLIVEGETVAYYASAGTTFGMGPEADYKAEVILFMTPQALQAFRDSRSWKVGEHATVPVVSDATDGVAALGPDAPLIGLIFSEDGLVSNLNLDGTSVTRIVR